MATLWSVCIATCGRPAGLSRLLASLAGQKLPPGLGIEVVVVDDDPAGTAAAVVDGLARFPHPLRYFVRGGRNVAEARNLCVEVARGDWILFVDDDEAASSGWVAAHRAAAVRGDADGIFGPVLPRLEPGGADWLEAGFYSRPRHASGTLLAGSDLRAGNACLRRDLFEVRRFDPGFGKSGGEDTELFGRMQAAGARFRWCDEAWVDEWVPAERRTLGWLSRRAFAGGAIHTRIRGGGAGGGWRAAAALRAAAAGLACLAVLPWALPGGRARAARVWLRACVQAGHLAALARGELG